jgi:hypothetical protein
MTRLTDLSPPNSGVFPGLGLLVIISTRFSDIIGVDKIEMLRSNVEGQGSSISSNRTLVLALASLPESLISFPD